MKEGPWKYSKFQCGESESGPGGPDELACVYIGDGEDNDYDCDSVILWAERDLYPTDQNKIVHLASLAPEMQCVLEMAERFRDTPIVDDEFVTIRNEFDTALNNILTKLRNKP